MPSLAAPNETTNENISSEVASPTRRAALLFGAAIPALLLLPRAARADADFGLGETRALQFLEELEMMQTDFFARATSSAAFTGMEERERDVFSAVANQDRDHAEWFALARQKYRLPAHSRPFASNLASSRPTKLWTFSLDAFANRAALFPVAAQIKDTAVGVYHHFAGTVGDGEVAQALASLAGVEGRHSAALHEIAGTDPFKGAVEPVVSPQTAARLFNRFGFRGESIQ